MMCDWSMFALVSFGALVGLVVFVVAIVVGGCIAFEQFCDTRRLWLFEKQAKARRNA